MNLQVALRSKGNAQHGEARSAHSIPFERYSSVTPVMSATGLAGSPRRGRDRAGPGPRVAGAHLASIRPYCAGSQPRMVLGVVSSWQVAAPMEQTRICRAARFFGAGRVVMEPSVCRNLGYASNLELAGRRQVGHLEQKRHSRVVLGLIPISRESPAELNQQQRGDFGRAVTSPQVIEGF